MLLTVAISLYTGMYRLRIDHWDKKNVDCQVVTQNPFPSDIHTRLPVRYHSQNSLSPRTSLGQHSSQLGPTSHYVLHPRVVIYFYIPHKRLKPGGHLHHTFLSTPSLAPSFRKCAACLSSGYHFKLSQALRQAFIESNGKDFFKDRSYGTAQTVKPSARHIYSDIFHPFIHVVETWNTRLQLIDTS